MIGVIDIKKFVLSVALTLVAAIVVLAAFSTGPVDVDNLEFNEAVNADFKTNLDNVANSDNSVYADTVGNEVSTVPQRIENEPEVSSNDRVIDPNKPMVALTFDDGPSPEYTEEILAVLEEYNSVATFFEIGQLAERYPELIKKEIEAGCELGNHSYSHPDLTTLSESEAIDEIEKTNDIFVEITGSPATLIRPPYGSIGDRASLFNQPVVTWSVDTMDWSSRNADSIMDTIYVEETLDGKVILMHSIYGSSLEAVRELVPYLIENGYQLVTVSELYEYKYGEEMIDGELYEYYHFM